jgi:hypothetical protein
MPSTIHIMKATRQSPMCVHDVAGESAVYYSIMKVCSSFLSAFMKRNVNFRMHLSALSFTFIIEMANSNGFGIKRIRTSTKCEN